MSSHVKLRNFYKERESAVLLLQKKYVKPESFGADIDDSDGGIFDRLEAVFSQNQDNRISYFTINNPLQHKKIKKLVKPSISRLSMHEQKFKSDLYFMKKDVVDMNNSLPDIPNESKSINP